ncbi:MAG: type II toxin-antitoxin system Phd/YefM family antitoxin [Planctomycetes bacterium]|nr:type II toxin-antitoxin system Phd/YefM family antitoxin [Planctomycetota bacterium]
MKTASISQTKNRLSALLDEVRRGETVLILDRGRPVARLVSAVAGAAEGAAGRVERLERAGVLRRPERARTAEMGPAPKLPRGSSALRALLAEREEGR